MFLAELQYSAPAEVDVPSLLTSWVSSGPVITVNSIQLQVDTTSPVVIDSMQAQSYSEATVIATAVGVSVLIVVIIITAVTGSVALEAIKIHDQVCIYIIPIPAHTTAHNYVYTYACMCTHMYHSSDCYRYVTVSTACGGMPSVV